jgi:hypothetical protein
MAPLPLLMNVIAAVVVVVLLVWLIKQIPVDQWVKSALFVLLVVVLLVWLLALFPIVHTGIQ